MQTNITEVQPAEFEMEITASAEDLAPKLKEALRAQRTQTSMKGFRPGKVPMSLVKKMYGRAIAYEIAERSIQETYEKEVLQSESYDVMGQPRLVALDYEDIDGEMQARIRFGVRPEFELKALSDETVTKLVHEVTSEDIDQEIDRIRERDAEMVPYDGEAGDDAFAVVDLQQLDDASGTPIIGAREEGVSFQLDDPRLKEELRDALKGKKAGDTFRVRLPHDGDHHHHEGEGHEHAHPHTHEYEVTVRELKKRVLPELTPEYVKQASGGEAEDEDALRAQVEKHLKSAWRKQGERYLHDRIVDRMIEMHEFHVPDSLVEFFLDSFVQDVKQRNENKLPPNFDEERFRAGNRDEAYRQAKWSLIRDRVIEESELEVTDEDRDQYFERAAEDSEVTKDALANFYRSVPNMAEQLDQQVLAEKVLAHLTTQFQVVEKNRDEVDAEIRERAEKEAPAEPAA